MTYVSKITAASPMLWFGNTLVSIVVPSTEGADQLCAIEHWMPFGDSPPRHLHRNEDEMFHIISGTLRFEVGGKVFLTERFGIRADASRFEGDGGEADPHDRGGGDAPEDQDAEQCVGDRDEREDDGEQEGADQVHGRARVRSRVRRQAVSSTATASRSG